VGKTTEPQIEAKIARYGIYSTPEATEKRGNRDAEEKRETIDSWTGNQIEMGVSEAEQGEKKEVNNEIEEQSPNTRSFPFREEKGEEKRYKKNRFLPSGREKRGEATPVDKTAAWSRNRDTGTSPKVC
jgi:hypothetical protein